MWVKVNKTVVEANKDLAKFELELFRDQLSASMAVREQHMKSIASSSP